MPGAADGYASDDEVTSKPLPHGYGALGDRPTRKRSAQVLEYGVRQGSGLRRPVREMPTGFRPDRLTGAQTRPRLSVEYHKVLLELVKKSKVTCMKSDLTILRENHRFLWDEPLDGSSWEMRMAKRYYDRLFKEYVICDLSGYRKGGVGFRWRTESEVVQGRGQFTCGHKFCSARDELKSYEVDFKYSEAGCGKRALVKVRLCQGCAFKLHYRRLKKAKKRPKTELEEAEAQEEGPQANAVQEVATAEALEPSEGPSATELQLESLAWRGPDPEARTREDDIDDYLRDLFL